MKKKLVRIVSIALGSTLACGALAAFAGCGGKKDALVIMSEELNGLFNPFYSTAGTDMDVVGQTQISMLSTDENGNIAYGDDEPVVVKDFMQEKRTEGGNEYTYYTFVLKNGIKFSDGVPLTMNDVLFNMYVYLDPAYTGSTTMYSTDIVGLKSYRLQNANLDTDAEDKFTESARNRADSRRNFLISIYTELNKKLQGQVNPTTVNVPPAEMRKAINGLSVETLSDYNLSSESWEAYKLAIEPFGDVGNPDMGYEAVTDAAAKDQLLKDYNKIVGTDGHPEEGSLWKELEMDWASAQSIFAEAPYTNQPGKEQTNTSGFVFDEIASFLTYEGLIVDDTDIIYGRTEDGKIDRNKIVEVNTTYYNKNSHKYADSVKTKERAMQTVYEQLVNGKLESVLMGAKSSGQELYNDFVATAKGVVMHENVGKDSLTYPKIDGIVSLGHNTEQQTVTLTNEDGSNGRTYNVAQEHDALGRPTDPQTYDVLQIKINGTDPKAIWNFGFTVAPWHYYSDPSDSSLQVDIENNKFGVAWSDFSFHTDVLQGAAKTYTYKNDAGEDVTLNFGNVTKNGVPLGAGPYVATDRGNKDFPSYAGFMSNNIVYYKANEQFFEGVDGKDDSLHAPFIKKMRYQVVSSANAIPALRQGTVHYVEPQLTKENFSAVEKMKNVTHLETWQLGYGYIGINAGKIENLNLRKAIMAAMDTDRATEYYSDGTVATIYWPMSLVSWAYPRTAGNTLNPNNPLLNKEDINDHNYATDMDDDQRIDIINEYTNAARAEGVKDSDLKVTLTIAGSSLTEHPCYAVFQHAKTLLEQCGWSITISPDVNALTKLATGSLTVWAAAWGSTIDPDMYQVYHKDSTATSVLAWGYPEILKRTSSEEYNILTREDGLSDKIDAARETDDQERRAELYKEAMGLVLDLAVELPVYQRQVMYALNSKVIDVETLPHDDKGNIFINPYSSPLAKIWEVKMK